MADQLVRLWAELTKWFQEFPTPYNLYNTDAGSPKYVFQIDGNFGFVSGITEMLLQSHADVVHLLPALPSAIPTGSVKGLVSRGNFVVDIAWEAGALTSANITSRAGAELSIRYMNGSQIAVDGEAYTGPLGTTAGTTGRSTALYLGDCNIVQSDCKRQSKLADQCHLIKYCEKLLLFSCLGYAPCQ